MGAKTYSYHCKSRVWAKLKNRVHLTYSSGEGVQHTSNGLILKWKGTKEESHLTSTRPPFLWLATVTPSHMPSTISVDCARGETNSIREQIFYSLSLPVKNISLHQNLDEFVEELEKDSQTEIIITFAWSHLWKVMSLLKRVLLEK